MIIKLIFIIELLNLIKMINSKTIENLNQIVVNDDDSVDDDSVDKIHIIYKENIEDLTYFDLINDELNNNNNNKKELIYKISNNQALIYQNNKWIHIQVLSNPNLSLYSHSHSHSYSHFHFNHKSSSTTRTITTDDDDDDDGGGGGSFRRLREESIPISNCLNQIYGDGGAIEIDSTIIYSMINTLDLSITLNVIFYYEKFTNSWELRKSLTIRNLYYCNVPKGYIGQIWSTFQFEEFNYINYRIVDFPLSNNNNKKQHLKKKKFLRRKLKFGKWIKFGKVLLFNNKKSPVIKCITTKDLNDNKLDCHGNALIKNSKNFQLL